MIREENKRGALELGKIITTIPIMILIFLVIAIYLILVVFIDFAKGPTVPAVLDFEDKGFNEILFKEINVDGELMSLVHGLIRAEINEMRCAIINSRLDGDPNNPIKSDQERIALIEERNKCVNYIARVKEGLIKVLEKEDKIFEGVGCFILCQSCNVKTGFKPSDLMKINSNEEDISLRFKQGKFVGSRINLASSDIETKIYTEKGLDNRLSFGFNAGGMHKVFDIVYYYGRCLE